MTMKEKKTQAYLKLKILRYSEDDVITTSTGVGSEENYDDMGSWKDSWSK